MKNSKYFDVIKEYHGEGFNFELQINWNIAEITGSKSSNGYIVQHFVRKSTPTNYEISDIEYFEAWKISNNKNIDSGSICDDLITVDSYDFVYNLKNSFNTQGQYKIEGNIYWIPQNSKLFKIVDSWSTNEVTQTNGLKGAYKFPQRTTDFFVFTKPPFIHTWSLMSDAEIERKVQKAMFIYCPNNNERDKQLLISTLNDIFDNELETHQIIKNNILANWIKQWPS